MAEPQNHTLRLLREMRAESREFREEVRKRFEEVGERFEEVGERFEEVGERLGQLDRIEAAVVGISYFQAAERGEVAAEIKGIKTRLARLENKIGLTNAPAE